MRLALIALGGAMGAVLRYTLAGWVQSLGGSRFPWGTLAVNVLGSFLLAYLIAAQLSATSGPLGDRHFWAIGVLGAFTTYSTFSYETVALLSAGDWTAGVANVTSSLILGLAAALLGLRLGTL